MAELISPGYADLVRSKQSTGNVKNIKAVLETYQAQIQKLQLENKTLLDRLNYVQGKLAVEERNKKLRFKLITNAKLQRQQIIPEKIVSPQESITQTNSTEALIRFYQNNANTVIKQMQDLLNKPRLNGSLASIAPDIKSWQKTLSQIGGSVPADKSDIAQIALEIEKINPRNNSPEQLSSQLNALAIRLRTHALTHRPQSRLGGFALCSQAVSTFL